MWHALSHLKTKDQDGFIGEQCTATSHFSLSVIGPIAMALEQWLSNMLSGSL